MPVIIVTNNPIDLRQLALEHALDSQLKQVCNCVSSFDEEPGLLNVEPLGGVGINPEHDLDFGSSNEDIDYIVQDVTDKLNESLLSGDNISHVNLTFPRDSSIDLDALEEELCSAFPFVEFIIDTDI